MGTKAPPAPDGGGIADRRKLFKRLSRASARDEEAQRAFIENKMEIVRTHPSLTDKEKERELVELRRRLKRPLKRKD